MGKDLKSTEANWLALSKDLGVSRTSLWKWRRLPNSPLSPELVNWQVFIEEHELGGVGKKAGKEREAELTKRVRHQNRLLEMEIAKKEATMVDRAEVNTLMFQLCSFAKTVLYQKFERELPPRTTGLTAPEITIIVRGMCDEVVEILRDGFSAWQQEQKPPTAQSVASLGDRESFKAATPQ